MSNNLIEEYQTVIKQYEIALELCKKDSDDYLYYQKHIELFKNKIKELGGEI